MAGNFFFEENVNGIWYEAAILYIDMPLIGSKEIRIDYLPGFGARGDFNKQVTSSGRSHLVIVSKGKLDSSEHMLVNVTALNIYINSKGDKPQRFQVVEMSAGRNSATMMLGFKQEQTDIPGFIPTSGFLEVASIKNKKFRQF